jgi:hypothetical protein
MLDQLGLGDLPGLVTFRQIERVRSVACAFRVARFEAVDVEVADDIPNRTSLVNVTSAIFAGLILCAENSTICAAPGHHRPAPHDRQQPTLLVVIDLPRLNPPGYAERLSRDNTGRERSPTGASPATGPMLPDAALVRQCSS